jgi:hypothetical protein
MSLREDFARWRDDPMTRTVLGALELAEKAQKQAWDDWSWGGDIVRSDDLADRLKELRVRADCYRALRELTVTDLCLWLGIEEEA